MSSFCGSDFHAFTNHDLHPCLQSLFINDIPPLLITIFGLYRIFHIYSRPIQLPYNEIQPRLPIVCTCVLAFIAAINGIRYVATSPILWYQLIQALLATAAWLIVTIVVVMERRRVQSLHYSIRIFWVADCLTLVKSIQSSILFLAQGSSLDDTMLLYFLRFPLAVTLVYYSLIWRKKCYDGDALMLKLTEEEEDVQGGGGVGQTPYSLVDDDSFMMSLPSSPPRGEPSGVWSRFLQFAGNGTTGRSNEQSIVVPPSKVHMRGVTHRPTGSFIHNRDSPLPRGQITATPPVDPRNHPLYGAAIRVPSYTQSTSASGIVLVQYSVALHIKCEVYTSGDTASDTLTVWKTYREFEGLHSQVQVVTHKTRGDTTTIPTLPTLKGNDYEGLQKALEIYMQALLATNTFLDELASFAQVYGKLDSMRQRAMETRRTKEAEAVRQQHQQQQAALAAPDTPSNSASPPLPSNASASSNTVSPAPATHTDSPRKSSILTKSPSLPDYTLLGVSVDAWMKWRRSPAEDAATTTTRRDSSARKESVTAKEEKAMNYVTFQIHVGSTRGDWNVHKRLQDLQSLRADLKKNFPKLKVPKLSVEKDYEKDETTLNTAKRTIEIFIQAVVSTSYFTCPTLFAVLAQEGHHTKRITKDRMIACSDQEILKEYESMLPVGEHRSSISESVPVPMMMARRKYSQATTEESSLPSASISIPPSRSGTTPSSSALGRSPARAGGGGALSSTPAAAARRLSHSTSGGLSSSYRAATNTGGAGSYIDSQHANALDSTLADDDDSDSDSSQPRSQNLSRHGSALGVNGEFGVLPSDAESGQLPQYKSFEIKRPDGNHRFTVGITKWMMVSDDSVGAAAATSAASSSSSTAVAAPSDETTTTNNKKSSSKKHVIFHIVVRQFFDANSYLEWTVDRRYQQFDSLHHSLKKSFPNIDLPVLPPKTSMFGALKKQSKSEKFLEKRRKALEIYLMQLINVTTFQGDDFFAFFDMKNSSRKITMGSLKDVQPSSSPKSIN